MRYGDEVMGVPDAALCRRRRLAAAAVSSAASLDIVLAVHDAGTARPIDPVHDATLLGGA